MADPYLEQLSLLLRTQDNRITHLPVFMVQRQVRDVGLDPDYAEDIAWFHCDDRGESDPEESARLEAQYQETGEGPEEYTRTGWRHRWENVQPFFTEEGAKEYLRVNGHNLGKTRIYVESAYRNAEWEFIRKLLIREGLTPEVRFERQQWIRRTPHDSSIDETAVLSMTDGEFEATKKRWEVQRG